MAHPDHSEGGRVTKPMSRRQEKKAGEKLKRAQSSKVLADADAAIRNSRAVRLHQIIRRPGRGGLTAKGADQLQQFFSKKVPEREKPSLREMDDSASMMLLQMAAEEVDAGGLSYGELRQVTEEKMMASGAENGQGGERDGKAEEYMVTEEVMKVEEGMGSEDEDGEQSGVALAKDL